MDGHLEREQPQESGTKPNHGYQPRTKWDDPPSNPLNTPKEPGFWLLLI